MHTSWPEAFAKFNYYTCKGKCTQESNIILSEGAVMTLKPWETENAHHDDS